PLPVNRAAPLAKADAIQRLHQVLRGERPCRLLGILAPLELPRRLDTQLFSPRLHRLLAARQSVLAAGQCPALRVVRLQNRVLLPRPLIPRLPSNNSS